VRIAVALGVLLAALWVGRALAAAGQLDPSFSGDGRVLTRFPGTSGADAANAMAIENGKIVAAGYSGQGVGYKFAIARYNPNGSLDQSFSSDGRQVTRFPGATGEDHASGVAIENGKIVVVGHSRQAGSVYKFALARYNPNGSLDQSFSGDGRKLTAFPGTTGNDEANAVAIENGKIVVAGYSHQAAGGYKFALARYNPNGSLDRSFSGDGRQITRFPGATGDDAATAVTIENGKIVAAGYTQQTSGGYKFALARYNPDGSLDRSFSGDGRQITRFPGAIGNDFAHAVTIENGKIVAAGDSQQTSGGYKFALARYNPDGSLDKTFSGDGLQITRFPGAIGNDVATAVTIENGKLVVAGYSEQTGGKFKFALASYNPDGSLDRSFSGDGRQITRFPGAVGDDEAEGVAIESGKIVVAGYSEQTSFGRGFAIARYLGG
jgi:uncharacterized delta-60 repeat protein